MTRWKRLRVARWLGLVLILLIVSGSALGLRVNLSESLPRGVYRVHVQDSAVAIGELVCFDARHSRSPASARALGASLPLLKRVAATAGATIEQDIESGQLVIDGRVVPCSRVLTRDTEGRALPSVAYPIVVPSGQVWLMSAHDQGFDSRYFGAVPIEALVCGRAAAIWQWERGVRCGG